jgi:hypothetical protein
MQTSRPEVHSRAKNLKLGPGAFSLCNGHALVQIVDGEFNYFICQETPETSVNKKS